MADSLRKRSARGDYDTYANAISFGMKLDKEVGGLGRDKHMRINYSVRPIPPRPATPPPPSPADSARMRAQMDELNCGFVKVEQLDGNVGYVKFNGLRTSARTFSGAEEFSYNLKSLKRATIIGETTGGGAHPVSGHAIGEHFMMGVPFARAVNPITRTNWEGTGVAPDVKVPAADALATALKLIREGVRQ
jgi:hypothetical protein